MKFWRFTPVKVVAGLLIVSVAVFGVTQTDRISAQWNQLTQEKPDTKLTFVEEEQLPEHYIPGQEQSFKFSFTNQEHTKVNYAFRVFATDMKAKKHVLGTGEATADNDKIGTVSPSFKMPDMGKHVKITVELEYTDANGKKQTKAISYWVKQKSKPSTDATA